MAEIIRRLRETNEWSVKLIDAEEMKQMKQTFSVGFSFIPESPRWLVVAGKTSKAETLLRKICSVNGREFPDSINLNMVENVSLFWVTKVKMSSRSTVKFQLASSFELWTAKSH